MPIDFVGGSSMGAVIAAGPAMDWGLEELEARIRKAYPKRADGRTLFPFRRLFIVART